MKKIFSVLVVLLLAVSMNGQTKKWTAAGVFPDTTNAKLFNSIHGIAVDPDGKVWIQDYYASTRDSVGVTLKGVLTWPKVRVLRIYKPNGTEASFSPMVTVTYPGGKDTLGGTKVNDSTWSTNTGRGMSVGPDGNIWASYFGTLYKINYKTGAGMLKIVVDNVNSITRAAIDTIGNVFVANVAPTYNMRMYSATGGSLGNAIDQTIGYSRGFEVSADGNSIFWAGYSLNKVMVYRRPDDLTPFSYKDSIIGMTSESMWRDPKVKQYIWVCAGPADNPPTDPKYTSHTFYKVNSATMAIIDSLNDSVLPSTNDAKHRGIAFSPNGDTAYVTAWPNSSALTGDQKIQRFIYKPVSVEEVKNVATRAFELNQNYPNPFNPSTKITYSVMNEGLVALKVYNILGKEVATLVNQSQKKGTYQTSFDAKNLPSGTYIYTLTQNGSSISKKMLLIK
ncbi:MAG: T9SS type A sorting domain-containing protein [Ignavibacteria bacterium]|nr:T9SS type A sorting domain-containing protein [Ignavibacteria bacterium]